MIYSLIYKISSFPVTITTSSIASVSSNTSNVYAKISFPSSSKNCLEMVVPILFPFPAATIIALVICLLSMSHLLLGYRKGEDHVPTQAKSNYAALSIFVNIIRPAAVCNTLVTITVKVSPINLFPPSTTIMVPSFK